MKIIISLLFCLIASFAYADQSVGNGNSSLTPSGDTSNTTSTSLGTPSKRTLAARGSDIVNIKDFGAICDDTSRPISNYFGTLAAAQAVYPTAQSLSDELDGVAIQNAITYLVTQLTYGGWPPTGRLVFPGGVCLTNTTLDFTQFTFNVAVVVDGAGTIIDSYGTSAAFTASSTGTALTVGTAAFGAVGTGQLYCVGVVQDTRLLSGSGSSWVLNHAQSLPANTPCYQGAPVIDMAGAIRLTIRDLAVFGDTLDTGGPLMGVRMGLLDAGTSNGGNAIEDVHIQGQFTFGPIYNGGSETTTFHHIYSDNELTGTACYSWVVDALNHWGFMPTRATESEVSLNENSVDGSSTITTRGGCTPIWLAGTARNSWVDSYVSNNSSTTPEVILWENGAGNRQLTMDVHFEQAPTDIFYIDQPSGISSVSLIGFHYRDHDNQATGSILKTNATITSAVLQGGSIEVAQFEATPNLFANPALWTGNPDVYLPSLTAWNWTTGFYGTLRAGNAPVVERSFAVDGTCVRQSLGATYTVPANSTCIRFTQGTTVAASTVTLPTAFADGHSIQFINYAGVVTALTFSPVVTGWTNGTALSANTGIRIRWDSTAATWQREQ